MSARDMFALVDVTTDGWGATADYSTAKRGEHPGNAQLFVHHPGQQLDRAADGGDTDAEAKALRAIERYAMRNGWWGLAYDIVVGQSGTVYAGRGLARSGATSGDVDSDGTQNNDESEAVLMLASPDTPMSDACRASLTRLLDAHGGDVYGHREAKGIVTSCPGDDRQTFIDAYRSGDLAPAPKPTPKPAMSWTETLVDNLPLLTQRKDLRRATDDDRRLQGLLVAAGVLDLSANLSGGRLDGKFGPSTTAAVRTFQSRAGLTVDGLVGRNTWAALLGR